MKKMVMALMCLSFLASCDTKKSTSLDFASYGAEIDQKDALGKSAMLEKFKSLKDGDTIAVKFATTINEVCKKKGCWMKLDLGGQKESMVTFKDYGFFVPLDADKKEVIVKGRAFVKKIPVEQLQHYAKDAGKSAEEIAAITAPEITYAIEADGVLVEK
ncbi:DUF4920 domain-containing protein [Flavobacteriaceae bacterium F08102]|nr:DUF4920 domain-containing protein [Flavobacteriaceae bacterium F08102]